jgi:hypothetical protein
VIGQHYDGYIRPHSLDFTGNGCAIQETQVVLEDDGIHGPRHKHPQTFGTVGCRCQLISMFLQQTQLFRIPVDTQERPVGCHGDHLYKATILQCCSKLLNVTSQN